MSQRKIVISGAAPAPEDIFAAVCAEVMTQDYKASRSFYEYFQPLPTQQVVYDTIAACTLPADVWIHVLLYGDTGGAKTWTAFAYALKEMLEHAGTTVLVVRETTGDIMLTSFGEVLGFLQRWNIQIKESNKTFGNIILENGSRIFFRSDKSLLKHNKAKADSLGSSAFSIVIFEEADSTSVETYQTVSGRMREDSGVSRKVVFAICNPPTERHWLWKKYSRPDRQQVPVTERRWHIFQMFAKDNPRLKEGYNKSKMEDWDDDPGFQRRMGLGHVGPETKGTPVFGMSFSRLKHVATDPKTGAPLDLHAAVSPLYPIWCGWDFGYNYPALVVLQDDEHRQQIRVLLSILEQDKSTWDVVDTWMPRLRQMFPGMTFKHACDPNGTHVHSTSGMSDIQVLNANGIYPIFRKSNIDYGISIIDKQLKRDCYGGNPSLLFDARCKDLLDSMDSGYCAKRDSVTGKVEINKDGVYDHIMDAFRYVMIHIRDAGWEYQSFKSLEPGWETLMDQNQARDFYASGGNMSISARPGNLPPGAYPFNNQAQYLGGSARRRKY